MKSKFLILFALVVFVFPAGTSRAITIPFTDAFSDNSTGSEWAVVTDNAAQLTVAETAGRVQVLSINSTSPTNDALYISDGVDGFRLLTSSDFEIRVDYSFASFQSSVDGGAFGLVFGIGRDLPDGTDSAAIGYGRTDVGPFTLGAATAQYRNNDVPSALDPITGSNAGTFAITYTSSTDSLVLGIVGEGSVTYNGLVQGLWGASSVYASFGGRGAGFVTAGSDAFFDNFQVVSGVPIPEPGAWGLVLAGAGVLGLRRFLCKRSR